jgi:dolichyl-phosphate-mannose--protein O-mannosyl transferase
MSLDGEHSHNPEGLDVKPASRAWYWLLLLPFVAMLWVGSYNKIEPTLWGFPFFYWYQLVWVLLCAVIVGIVFVATRRGRD